jgi:hypothetical protein
MYLFFKVKIDKSYFLILHLHKKWEFEVRHVSRQNEI